MRQKNNRRQDGNITVITNVLNVNDWHLLRLLSQLQLLRIVIGMKIVHLKTVKMIFRNVIMTSINNHNKHQYHYGNGNNDDKDKNNHNN